MSSPRSSSSNKKKRGSKKARKATKKPARNQRTSVRVPKTPVRVYVPYPYVPPYVQPYVHRPVMYNYVPRPHVHSPPQHHQHHVHEHLNRVNYAHESELSRQDLEQRKLKERADSYVPNVMHVSSDELAIPAPYLRKNGMRVFSSS